MMIFKNLKISRRLVLGFSVVLFFSFIACITAIIEIRNQWSNIRDLYEKPFMISNMLRDIKINALNIRRYMLDITFLKDESQRQQMMQTIDREEADALASFEKIAELYSGEESRIDESFEYFKSWRSLRDDILGMIKSGDEGRSAELVGTRNRIFVENLFTRLQADIDSTSTRAESLYLSAQQTKNDVIRSLLIILTISFLISIIFSYFLTRSISVPLKRIVKNIHEVAMGNLNSGRLPESTDEVGQLSSSFNKMQEDLKDVVEKARRIAQGDLSGELIPKSASDELAHSLNEMTVALRTATARNAKSNRLKTAQNELNEAMRGDLSLGDMAVNIITYLATSSNAQIGALYLYVEDQKGYELTGSYAFDPGDGTYNFFHDGEGLAGQAAIQKKIMTFSDFPEDYIKISSGLGNTRPKNILIAPFIHEGHTIGVIELGSVNAFDDETYELLDIVLDNIAISFVSAISRTTMAKLFELTKAQAEELQVQQEELKETNEELEEQTLALRKSEENLQLQQEELRVTNEELEQKTSRLEEHKSRMELQNKDLEIARKDIEKKAKELEITNKYKSNFLANMSHELRTPLNSLLLLAQSLVENKGKNLTPQQVESAKIIYNSGNDLLSLINEILDLSRIESGKLQLLIRSFPVSRVERSIRDYFERAIQEKGLIFSITKNKDVPEKIFTDEQRLNQILRNLMSNAVKFTEKGRIDVHIYIPQPDENLSLSKLSPEETIAFSVKDTGIGIPAEKQLEIFEAFQQVDGSISRKYGGTGLGLSITRELARLLGGEIKLYSQPGTGSEFTVFLPVRLKVDDEANAQTGKTADNLSITDKKAEMTGPGRYDAGLHGVQIQSIPDSRNEIEKSDNSILIIDDDPVFALTLADICREKGFSYLHTATGEEGLELAIKYLPRGIILDIRLPGMNGWQVLEKLKDNAATRHIPVHMVSVNDETIDAFNRGAIGYLTKPVDKEKLNSAFGDLQSFINREVRELLIIGNNKEVRSRLKSLLGTRDIRVTECSAAKRAMDLISSQKYGCVVLDTDLKDMTAFDMLNSLKEKEIRIPPVIVYTGNEITPDQSFELQQFTQNIIVKGVKSEERLLDETSLFLHRVVSDMPEKQRKMLINLHDRDEMFRGRTILIVDDDMRNVFAITQLLEASNMKVIMASNGKKAIEALRRNPEIDLILMDIMMPVMDGYEAMQYIRSEKSFSKIPIIALTAKAMKEDREKSLAAGASDYLTKPVDIDKLFNLIRIWLYQ